jgi:hypothetical protein
MSTIVATKVAGVPLATVQVDITITTLATVTAWSVTRDAGSAGLVVIRSGTTPAPAALSIVDAEAPIERPMTYVLTVARAPAASEVVRTAAVTITGTVGCYLSDPYSAQAMSIDVQSWPERLYASRAVSLLVLGRGDPIVLADAHTLASGQWKLISFSDAATAQMKAILMGSGFVQLRTQPTTSIPSVYAAVLDVTEVRYSGSGTDQRRIISVDLQEIAPLPSSARDLGSTLNGLSKQGASLAALNALRPTLLQLSQMRVGA